MTEFSQTRLGQHIYDRRRACHLSQEELAYAAGVSADLILRIEKGYVSTGVDKVWTIAQVLDCSPNDLLGWDEDAN
nr:MAG TPA: helix-turn-helix XRE-family like protein [Caudoviricetes sp.]